MWVDVSGSGDLLRIRTGHQRDRRRSPVHGRVCLLDPPANAYIPQRGG